MIQKVGERKLHSLHAVQGQEWISGLRTQRGRLKVTSSRRPVLHGFCSFQNYLQSCMPQACEPMNLFHLQLYCEFVSCSICVSGFFLFNVYLLF